jgi:Disulphide bond corrector protein DsbC
MDLSRHSSGRKLLNEPAEQAAEFSLGWSERSERNPGYQAKMNYQARFSGRQRVTLLFLILTIALASCRRETQSGTYATPSASPAPISSSKQVVKLSSLPVSIPANGSAEAVVTLSISAGYHINSNPATFPYLIATEIQHISDPDEGIQMGKPIYPIAEHKKFDFSPEKPLAVYEGEVTIKLPLSVGSAAHAYASLAKGWQGSFPINARVQACDNEKCFPPDTLEGSIRVTIN